MGNSEVVRIKNDRTLGFELSSTYFPWMRCECWVLPRVKGMNIRVCPHELYMERPAITVYYERVNVIMLFPPTFLKRK
jgi:hypothetical protein